MRRKPKRVVGKRPRKDKLEYSRWEKKSEENPSIDRPADRSPTVRNLTVGGRE